MLKAIIAACLSRRTIVLFGLFAFAVAGLYAFKVINIESYPNPTPVILEITAQAPGLSAEEIERYYTIPMEIALYATPGVQVIRSTSFYGLAFVRVVFKYGIDYDFAYRAGDARAAAERHAAGQPAAIGQPEQRQRRDLPLHGGRAEAHSADESAHDAGLDRAAAPV